MFREIRRSEKITEKSDKERELDYLYKQLFDCRVGSEEYNHIRTKIDVLVIDELAIQTIVEQTITGVFNPDARI